MSGSAELQRQLVDACVRHLGSAASVLEWGDGAAMLHALRRLGTGGRGVAIVADDKTYQAAQAAVSNDGTHNVIVTGNWGAGLWRYVEP